MDLKRSLIVHALAISTICLSASEVRANASEDVFGVGTRSISLAGAGTATARDFSATYYNPANLALCKRHQLSVGVQQIFNELGTDVDVSQLPTVEDPFNPGQTITDPQLVPIEPENRTRIHLGVCIPLPAKLALGVLLNLGIQDTVGADPNTVAENPRFFAYGSEMDTLTMQLALAYRPFRWLSIGLGASILANIKVGSVLAFSITSDDPSDSNVLIRAKLEPRIAPIAGIYVSPIPELEFGLTFRGKLDSRLTVPSFVNASSGAISIEATLLADGRIWHSPNQLAFGVAGRPIDSLLLTVDITWYQTSKNPGPFIEAISIGDVLGGEVLFPPLEDFGFRDIFVPRFGVEYLLLAHDALALRGGYMFRPWSAAVPGSSDACQAAAQDPGTAACRANLLDNSSHWISIGAGYTFRLGAKPKADGDPGDPGGLEVSDTRTELTIDAFFRAGIFQERRVSRTEPPAEVPYLRDYNYGGQIYDLGGTVTLAWR